MTMKTRAIALLLAFGLLGNGCSTEERDLIDDPEQEVPADPGEFDMTEDERQDRIEMEDQQVEDDAFDRAEEM